MKEIALSKGYVTIVDDEDYDWASEVKWSAAIVGRVRKKVYAVRDSSRSTGRKRLLLHREIMKRSLGNDAIVGFDIDHINGDSLDNRRVNLRLATRQQNIANGIANSNSLSGIRGVSWSKHAKKWTAQITFNRKVKRLGYFKTKEDAARAYDAAAKICFGEFASRNGL